MPEQEKQFDITTTAQVERTYRVRAIDEEQARKRLRIHLDDPDLLREGLVVHADGKQVDATAQKIKPEGVTLLLPPGAATKPADKKPDDKKKPS